MNIHVEGNWIGFRMDGSYNANYRSGLNNPGSGRQRQRRQHL